MTESRRPVVVVTGASAGVGRATARLFAERGYDIGLLSRGETGLRAAATDVEDRGGRAVVALTDVSKWEEVQRAGEQVVEQLGGIDVWVNNAMLTVFGPISELDPAEIRRVSETTYLGQVHGAFAALQHMRPANAGTIVSVSSTLAHRSIPLQAAYCAGKSAARAFLESLRSELLHDGVAVRVSQVVLPAVNTPQFGWSRSKMRQAPRPVAPVYPPEAAAGAVFRAAQHAPRQLVLGSWNRVVLMLNKVMPGVLDHATALSSWEGQLTHGTKMEPRRGNLLGALDGAGASDPGADGVFGDEDHGVLDPAFVRAMPALAASLGHAAIDRVNEVLHRGAVAPGAAAADRHPTG